MQQQSKNYFELFGLPISYEIDLQQLSDQYQNMQRVVHPDRFANAPDHERRHAVQQAALINDAFQTLKDSLKRARYLLSMHDIVLDDKKNRVMDTSFLMEQMELREELESIASTANPMAELDRYLEKVRAQMKDIDSELNSLFLISDAASLEKAAKRVQQLQFYRRLQEEAMIVEEDLTLDF